jgi:histidinol-phosphate aminotransferase
VQLRKDLTNRLANLHDVSPEMVTLGNGSGEILRMAAGAFLGGDRVLVAPHPTFEAIVNYALLFGVPQSQIKQIPVTADFRHDVAKMAVPKAGLIYVCNPNNPTSSVTPKKELDSLVANLPSGAVLLVDEAYYHFADSPEYESAMKHVHAGKDVFVVRTFSKVYGLAGLRVGYAVGRPELIDRLRRHAMDNNTNAMGLQAALTSIDDADQVSRNRDRNAATRRMVLEWLDRNKMKYAPAPSSSSRPAARCVP